jgi:hypothetical protein
LLRQGSKVAVAKVLYVGAGYGPDHKADEWSARRRSLGYRLVGEVVEPTDRLGYVFVLDGVWTPKAVRKLHAAGWDRICRLPDLEGCLRHLFGLPPA